MNPTIKQPRRMLMYLGNIAVKSLAAEIELAEMLVPMVANAKANEQKNRAARPFPSSAKLSIKIRGFQSSVP